MSIKTEIVWNIETLKHFISYTHPDHPRRILNLVNFLENEGTDVINLYYPIDDENLLKVHKKSYILDLKLKKIDKLDKNTPIFEKTFEIAKISASLALYASKSKAYTFALCRPPGNNAGYNFGGKFCYINNICVGVFNNLSKKNVLILDLDLHFGYGTADIVSRFSEGNILYASIHREDEFVGRFGKNVIYSPVPKITTISEYLRELEFLINTAERRLKDIDCLALSLGLDTYLKDPMGGFMFFYEDYYKIGEIIGKFVDSLGLEFFCVLEGGYSKDLPILFYNFYKGFENSI